MYDGEDLLRLHPPSFRDVRKRKLFEGIQRPLTGRLEFSRWRGELPHGTSEAPWPEIEVREDVFTYPLPDAGASDWHLNFADAHLFGFYGGSLLAQDEHQVLEHPVLGSLREALVDSRRQDVAPLTRERGPTPCLVQGAQRSLHFDTIRGPYGNAFVSTPMERIMEATSYLDPPTSSNIVAMQAPPGGRGDYGRGEIEDILRTAFVGFRACVEESSPNRTVIHTGNWGCGAFGGNPVAMALLQVAAARLAGVERLIYHTFSPRFAERCRQGLSLLDELAPGAAIDSARLVGEVFAARFEWGESDGN